MNQYEAMFLFDPTFGASFENCESVIRRLMDRADAEIVFCRKWDERRLAYKIKGRKRGVYVLVYFKAPAEKVGSIERDAQITEEILRLLILRADGVTPEAMEKAAVPRSEEESSDDSRDSRDSRREPSRPDRRPERREAVGAVAATKTVSAAETKPREESESKSESESAESPSNTE